MPVADNAVDRPLVDVVIDAIDADNDLSDEAKYFVLAALEGPTALQELLDGVSTPHVPEPSGSQLVGDVVGHQADLAAIIKVHNETGALPTTDWESVASLGPQLQVGIERLRDHAKRTVNSFDAGKPVQECAAYLARAVKDERLCETLQLVVIVERSLCLWQTLRIARVRAVEPEHLDPVVASAREMLADHVERDGDLLRNARLELSNFGTVKPLEIVRWMATGDLNRDITQLRNDLDASGSARNSQVTGWIDNEDPSSSDAFSELGNHAKQSAVPQLKSAARQ